MPDVLPETYEISKPATDIFQEIETEEKTASVSDVAMTIIENSAELESEKAQFAVWAWHILERSSETLIRAIRSENRHFTHWEIESWIWSDSVKEISRLIHSYKQWGNADKDSIPIISFPDPDSGKKLIITKDPKGLRFEVLKNVFDEGGHTNMPCLP